MEPARYEELTLTVVDHARLLPLAPASRRMPASASASRLAEILEHASLVPSREVPADVITMRSRVLLKDPGSAQQRVVTLAYPQDAHAGDGAVSVLSPAGASLLGQRTGTVARWTAPDGREHAAEVAGILWQPEAAGEFSL